MSTRQVQIIITLLLITSVSTYANGIDIEKHPFFQLEGRNDKIKIPVDSKIPEGDLPDEVVSLLKPFIHNHLNVKSVPYVLGKAFDLTGNGTNDYFINIPRFGGSGGAFYVIISKYKNKWCIIGSNQGWFKISKEYTTHHGIKWPKMLWFSRGGAGHYSRELVYFSGEKYVRESLYRYKKGKIVKVNP